MADEPLTLRLFAGDRPPRYGIKNVSRGAVGQVEGLRGTGPRATVLRTSLAVP